MSEQVLKNKWEEEVKLFIKDQPRESYNHEVVNGIAYEPFAIDNDQNYGPLEVGKSKIGVQFDHTSTNKQILFALANGAQSIEINIGQDTPLDQLLEGVRLDYILPIFIIENEIAKEKLIKHLNNNYNNKVIDRVIISNSLVKLPMVRSESILLEYAPTDTIDQIVNIILKIKENPNENLTLIVSIGKKFFYEIAKLRAIRILIANVYRDLNVELSNLTIVARVKSENDQLDYHNSLIHQTSAALSAKIGGANIVQLQQWSKNNDINNDRLSLNIQNILHLESHIDKYQDVMAGSYFVEDLTDKIAIKVWEKL